MLGLVVLLAAILLWGVAIEPHLIDEEESSLELAGLPADWDGRRVAVIGDLQVGMWLDNTNTIRRIVEELVDEPPALVLIAGDFIYHPVGDVDGPRRREDFDAGTQRTVQAVIGQAVELVHPLAAAGIPTYAVLGNHDYAMETRNAARLDWVADDLRRALEAAGVRVLRNAAVTVPPPAGDGERRQPDSLLYVVGIGSNYAGRDDPAKALSQVPSAAPRLVLMHHPGTFAEVPARAAPLAFAGHTHGGQISLPWAPQWSWMALMYPDEVHADGWIGGYGAEGNQLYVTRGIGFSLLPIRIGATPEVTLIRLWTSRAAQR